MAALGAAPTAIPGVVFQGAGDGRLFAVSSTDGKHCGSSTPRRHRYGEQGAGSRRRDSTAGAVIVDGMVYIGSGYAISSGAQAGNVLLAFGVE